MVSDMAAVMEGALTANYALFATRRTTNSSVRASTTKPKSRTACRLCRLCSEACIDSRHHAQRFDQIAVQSDDCLTPASAHLVRAVRLSCVAEPCQGRELGLVTGHLCIAVLHEYRGHRRQKHTVHRCSRRNALVLSTGVVAAVAGPVCCTFPRIRSCRAFFVMRHEAVESEPAPGCSVGQKRHQVGGHELPPYYVCTLVLTA